MIQALPLVFLVVCALALSCSLLGRYRALHCGPLRMPFFFISWWVSELAWLHLVIQATFAVVLIAVLGITNWWMWTCLGLLSISMLLLLIMHLKSGQTHRQFTTAFNQHFGSEYRNELLPERRQYFKPRQHWKSWLLPFRMTRSGVTVHRDIAYGDHPRHRLDIFQSSSNPEKLRPVILQIHGGGWVVGDKSQQGQPLLHHLAERGWVGVAINYRRAPKHRFPDPLIDSKRALAWVKENISAYGGDADFIVVTGGSAGGHLALLTALTPNRHEFQPGFVDYDTSVAACVSFYAVYDFTDRHCTYPDRSFQQFLTRFVMPKSIQEAPELWEQASPIAQISSSAPPLLLIHGDNDVLVPVEQATAFSKNLHDASSNAHILVKLPAAQHAYDVFHSVRTEQTIDAVQRYLELLYSRHINSVH